MEEKVTIEEMNRVIADWMEYKPWLQLQDGYKDFHKDWRALMPVVEKIEKGNFGFKMCRKVVEVYFDDSKEVILKVKKSSRIESLHQAVYDFIQYHK